MRILVTVLGIFILLLLLGITPAVAWHTFMALGEAPRCASIIAIIALVCAIGTFFSRREK